MVDCAVSFIVRTTSPGGNVTQTVKNWAEEAAEARQQAHASAAAAAHPPDDADAVADADADAEPGHFSHVKCLACLRHFTCENSQAFLVTN